MAPGTQADCRHILYCGRRLGRRFIPGSNGRWGPRNGPQCEDCRFTQLQGQEYSEDATHLKQPPRLHDESFDFKSSNMPSLKCFEAVNYLCRDKFDQIME